MPKNPKGGPYQSSLNSKKRDDGGIRFETTVPKEIGEKRGVYIVNISQDNIITWEHIVTKGSYKTKIERKLKKIDKDDITCNYCLEKGWKARHRKNCIKCKEITCWDTLQSNFLSDFCMHCTPTRLLI